MAQYQELDIAEMALDGESFLPGDIITFTGPGEHDVTTREVTQKLTFVEILTKQGISASEIRNNRKLAVRKVLRPIPELPTVPGYYSYGNLELSDGVAAYRLHTNGDWSLDGQKMPKQEMREITPLTRLVPETESTSEKLADRIDVEKLGGRMSSLFHGDDVWADDAAALIAAIDNGELDK